LQMRGKYSDSLHPSLPHGRIYVNIVYPAYRDNEVWFHTDSSSRIRLDAGVRPKNGKAYSIPPYQAEARCQPCSRPIKNFFSPN
jgi:hypothetical protein